MSPHLSRTHTDTLNTSQCTSIRAHVRARARTRSLRRHTSGPIKILEEGRGFVRIGGRTNLD
uniref:Uncharacterized protein n=1 Tax=Anguilla anguilla TaxID=7936 RepID=A0A0E9WW48_ANGAN